MLSYKQSSYCYSFAQRLLFTLVILALLPIGLSTNFNTNNNHLNIMPSTATSASSSLVETKIQKIQDIIGTDAGDRGMKAFIVPGDLYHASNILGNLPVGTSGKVLVLSGFPCCVSESPPTETDGPPGAYAIARAATALGHDAVVVTDDCNQAVFQAALNNLSMPSSSRRCGKISLECFPAILSDSDQKRFDSLAQIATCIIACERAGPGADGNCYTMREINMNEKGLIAPLDELIAQASDVPFLAIGDGGNEMGMGKVIDKIKSSPKIVNADKIGCVVAADHLIAASVSNWGGYALAAGAALVKASLQGESSSSSVKEWINQCLPTEQEEVELLARCVAAGCRDGVSGKMESTVDGMPLETSLQCLRDIRNACLSSE